MTTTRRNKARITTALLAATFLALALSGCAGGGGGTPAADPQKSRPAGSAVEMKDVKFGPAAITVPAGTQVTWTNHDPFEHTVTAADGSFDSGNLGQGATWSHAFDAPGTYHYYCKPHASKGSDGKYQGMTGTVIVT